MNDAKLIYFRHNTASPAHAISPSRIGYLELTLLLHGSVTYYVEGVPHRLEGGDAILIPAGALRARDESEQAADYVSFNFITDTPPVLPLVMEAVTGSEIKLLLATCDEVRKKYFFAGEDILLPLLTSLVRLLAERLERRRQSTLTRDILRFIEGHLTEKITLADVGAATFFSPAHCEAVFKRETGHSILDYWLSARVSEAKRLLLEGSLSLKDVAAEVGFLDYNYFARVFKKKTGYTPRALKRGAKG